MDSSVAASDDALELYFENIRIPMALKVERDHLTLSLHLQRSSLNLKLHFERSDFLRLQDCVLPTLARLSTKKKVPASVENFGKLARPPKP